jgi:hypothetical protein
MRDQYRTPIRVVRRDAKDLNDWKRLAQKSPAAVPVQVAKTLANRYPELRHQLGFA